MAAAARPWRSRGGRGPRPPVPLPTVVNSRKRRIGSLPEEAHLGDGIQRPGLEPVSVLPGRYWSASADVKSILDEFECRLTASTGTSRPSKRTQAPGALPETGAFAVLRELFRSSGFSSVIERERHEVERDVFQFVMGVCWTFLLSASSLERRAGVLFLVYLLFNAQHPGRFAVPVDLVVLQALLELRRECEERSVLLECPKILHSMASMGALSVGIRATCRTLYFDVVGRVAERQTFDPRDEEGVASVPDSIPTKRLQVLTTPGEVVQGTGASGSEQRSRQQPVDLGGVLLQAQDYDAEREGAAVCSEDVADRVVEVASLVARYQRATPPEPRDVVVVGDNSAIVQAAEREQPPLRKRRRRLARIELSSSSESGDSTLEELEQKGLVHARTAAEAERLSRQRAEAGLEGQVETLGLPSKAARQGTLIGIEKALERQARTGRLPYRIQHLAPESPGAVPGGAGCSGGAVGASSASGADRRAEVTREDQAQGQDCSVSITVQEGQRPDDDPLELAEGGWEEEGWPEEGRMEEQEERKNDGEEKKEGGAHAEAEEQEAAQLRENEEAGEQETVMESDEQEGDQNEDEQEGDRAKVLEAPLPSQDAAATDAEGDLGEVPNEPEDMDIDSESEGGDGASPSTP